VHVQSRTNPVVKGDSSRTFLRWPRRINWNVVDPPREAEIIGGGREYIVSNFEKCGRESQGTLYMDGDRYLEFQYVRIAAATFIRVGNGPPGVVEIVLYLETITR